MNKGFWASILVWILCAVSVSGQYANDWIDYNQTYYKFLSDETGIHRITYSELVGAGIPLTGANFKMYNDGEEIPLYVSTNGTFGTSDYIEFYGKKNDGEFDTQMYSQADHQLGPYSSLFTQYAAYFLTSKSGVNLRYETVANNIANPPATESYYMHEVVHLQNNVFHPGVPHDDIGQTKSYFADYEKGEGFVSLSTTNNQTITTLVTTPYVYNSAGVPAEVETRVVGREHTVGVNPDQHYQIKVNEDVIIDNTFEAYDIVNHSFTIPLSAMNFYLSNKTTFRLAPVDDFSSSNVNNAVSIPYYIIRYPRMFNFDDEPSFEFSMNISSSKYIEVDNFDDNSSNVYLYDLTNNKRIQAVKSGGKMKVRIDPEGIGSTERDFIMSNSSNGLIPVNGLEQVDFVDYAQSANQGNYIMITNDALRTGGDPIADYEAYRNSSAGGGYDVVVVDVNQLFDQFAIGIRNHPLGIKNFTNYAMDTWGVTPEMVFLVGKSIVYNKITYNSTFFEQCLVPSYGNMASDNLLVSSPSYIDWRPRVPIARLPAQNAAQVAGFLDILMEYEANFNAPCTKEARAWLNDVLHIGKGWDPGELGDFLDQLDDYEDREETAPSNFEVIATLQDGVYKNYLNNNALKPYLEDGLAFINYVGHASQPGGSTTYWQFDVKQPGYYNNPGKYPFILSNSCFVGQIHNPPGTESQAEDFVLEPNGGSIGFLATLALSFPTFLDQFTTRFLDFNFQSHYGEAISKNVKRTIDQLYATGPFNEGNKVTALEFTFSGDPAIKFISWDKPEYVIETSDVFISQSSVNPLVDPEVNVTVYITNIGKAESGTVNVRITRTMPNGTEIVEVNQFVSAPQFEQGYTFSFDVGNTDPTGIHQILVEVDPDDTVDEDCEFNNDVTKSINVNTPDCDPINLQILNVEDSYCSSENSFVLQSNFANGTFRIDGASTSILNPGSLSVGTHVVSYEYIADNDCPYGVSQQVEILAAPEADFELSEIQLCNDNSLEINFMGIADAGAEFFWNFGNGASPASSSDENPGNVTYSSGGTKTVSLSIVNDNGCTSDPFQANVQVDVPLTAPVVSCGSSTSTSLTIEWESVPGADTYLYYLDGGTFPGIAGGPSATSKVINGLSVDQSYTIELFAEGGGVCGDGPISTIECSTSNCPTIVIQFPEVPNAVCASETPFLLQAEPAGGSFSGPGVNGSNEFNPALQDGFVQLTYTYNESGCVHQDQVNINVTGYYEPEVQGSLLICEGETTTLEIVGDYESYTWSNNSEDQMIEVGTPDDYTITVEDAQGCVGTATVSVELDVDSYPEADFTVSSNEVCLGETVTLSQAATNGEVYNWELIQSGSGDISTETGANPEISILEAGTYTVRLTVDGCGTTTATEIKPGYLVVNELPELSVPNSFGVCEGEELDIIATSGVNISNITWSGADIIEENGLAITIAPVADAVYTIEIEDDKGCTNLANIDVNILTDNDPVADFQLSSINVCAGTGIMLTDMSLNAESYTWSVLDTDDIEVWTSLNSGDQEVILNEAGTYSVSLMVDGCGITTDSKLESDIIVVNAIPSIDAEADNLIVCDGQEVTITATESTNVVFSGPEIVSEVDGVMVAAPTQDLQYTVTFTDENNCSNSATLDIEVFGAPTVELQADNQTICNGSEVVITSSVSTNISWTGPDITNEDGAEITATPSADATYTLSYTDDNNCTNEYSIIINVNELPELELTADNQEICEGGTVILTSSESNNITWAGPNITAEVANTATATPTEDATYTLTYLDDANCEVSTTIDIDVVILEDVEFSSDKDEICSGEQVVLTASVTENVNIEGPNVISVIDGVATVEPTDDATYIMTYSVGECEKEVTLDIMVNALPELDLNSSSTAICFGEEVSINSSITQNIVWDGPAIDSQADGMITATPDANATYTATYTDENSCSVTETIDIEVYDEVNLELEASKETICAGEEITITASQSGTLIWDGDDIVLNEGDVITVAPTANATYSVTYTDGNSCQVANSIDIIIDDTLNPTAAFDAPESDYCSGESLVLINNSINAESYSWIVTQSVSGTTYSSDEETPEFVLTEAGDYDVQLYVGGCGTTDDVKVETLLIKVYEELAVDVSADRTEVCEGDELILTAAIDGYSGDYDWYIGDELLGTTSEPTYTLTVDTRDQDYRVIVANEIACSYENNVSLDFKVSCEEEPVMTDIPNAITPNGDGANDTWVVRMLDQYPNNEVIVYNRWGEKVFEAAPYLNDWDGTRNGKVLTHGTYYYVISLGDDSDAEPMSGHLSIIR